MLLDKKTLPKFEGGDYVSPNPGHNRRLKNFKDNKLRQEHFPDTVGNIVGLSLRHCLLKSSEMQSVKSPRMRAEEFSPGQTERSGVQPWDYVTQNGRARLAGGRSR